MPSVFNLIGTSWEFYKKQNILNQVIIWMLILPMSFMFVLTDLTTEGTLAYYWLLDNLEMSKAALFMLSTLLNLGFSLWMLWGTGCVLLIGKRLIKSPAGRTRTSFAAVRKQATKFIVPLLFTDILRDCFSFLWAILLIVPGIIYRVRTALYHVAIVCDGKEYRAALKQSQELVKGHSWNVFFLLLGVTLSLFAPAMLISMTIQSAIITFDERFTVVGHIFTASILAFTLTLYLLSSISLYKALKSA